MQNQFFKRFQTGIIFFCSGRTSEIIITILTLGLISNSLLICYLSASSITAIFALVTNCIMLISLYQYSQTIKSGIKSRQAILETTFETIHNGPLQSLSIVLRLVKGQDLPINKLLPSIEKEVERVNQELRGIYEFCQQETLNQDTSLYLENGVVIDLQNPLHEILYQVYSYTLDRDFPCFRTLKLKIHNFETIDQNSLSLDKKRGLCRFLEEALCNVGKHANGITCLQVTYSASKGYYNLRIMDNGVGIQSLREGWGTKQFKRLATQIKGKFRRVKVDQGTLCELSWPLSSSFW
jgi:hypothetical protein